MAVPSSKALRVLCSDACSSTIGATEHDGARYLACRHVECLGSRVDDLVNRLHGKVEGHELAHGSQSGKCRAHCNACETSLRSRGEGGAAAVRRAGRQDTCKAVSQQGMCQSKSAKNAACTGWQCFTRCPGKCAQWHCVRVSLRHLDGQKGRAAAMRHASCAGLPIQVHQRCLLQLQPLLQYNTHHPSIWPHTAPL